MERRGKYDTNIEIRRLRAAGADVKDIAHQYGLSAGRVRQICGERKRPNPDPAELAETIAVLANAGIRLDGGMLLMLVISMTDRAADRLRAYEVMFPSKLGDSPKEQRRRRAMFRPSSTPRYCRVMSRKDSRYFRKHVLGMSDELIEALERAREADD